jgi:membrane protein
MRLRGRVDAVQHWLARRADSKLGRISLQWFRAYFEASRNSGSAATLYSFLSVVPVVLAAVGLLHAAGANTDTFAHHLIDHLHLDRSTAGVVTDTFGSSSANALAASLAAVVGFLIWGIGIGQIYQDVYARAWGIKVGSIADQGLFALFFFLVSGAIAVALVSAASLRARGWIVVVPAWLIASTAFWLLIPSLLLHRKIGLRALLPGALLASVVLGGTIATSPLFLAAPLNANGKAFGSFGVVLTVIGYVFVMITMSLVCAVFSPVWADWRRSRAA